AELVTDRPQRQDVLTLSVVGGELRGTAMAAEVRALINSALPSDPGIGTDEPRILLFEEKAQILPRFTTAIERAARRRLERLGVEVFTKTWVAAVTPEDVVISPGQRIPCRTAVAAWVCASQAIAALLWAGPDGRLPVDESLRVQEAQN